MRPCISLHRNSGVYTEQASNNPAVSLLQHGEACLGGNPGDRSSAECGGCWLCCPQSVALQLSEEHTRRGCSSRQ